MAQKTRSCDAYSVAYYPTNPNTSPTVLSTRLKAEIDCREGTRLAARLVFWLRGANLPRHQIIPAIIPAADVVVVHMMEDELEPVLRFLRTEGPRVIVTLDDSLQTAAI